MVTQTLPTPTSATPPRAPDAYTLADLTDVNPASPQYTADMRGLLANADVPTRMAFYHRASKLAGLSEPDLLPGRYEGDALIPIGQEKLRALRAAVDAMPWAVDAHQGVTQVELIEDAKDIGFKAQHMRLSDVDGGLIPEPGTPARRIEWGAWRDSLSYMGAPTGAPHTLAALPLTLRAAAFNHFAQNSTRVADVVGRTYCPQGGRRAIRSMVTPRYAPVPDSIITQAIASEFPRDAKIQVTRSNGVTHFEIIFPMMNREIRVGDILTGRVLVTNSQGKETSLDIEAGVLRAICYNLTTAYAQDKDAFSMRHVGNGADMLRRARAALRMKYGQILPFVMAFGDSYKDALPNTMGTRGEVLGRVGKVFKGEVSPDVLTLAGQLWDVDGVMSAGDTRGGLVNALTKASQSLPYSTATKVEAVAGRIVSEGWAALKD